MSEPQWGIWSVYNCVVRRRDWRLHHEEMALTREAFCARMPRVRTYASDAIARQAPNPSHSSRVTEAKRHKRHSQAAGEHGPAPAETLQRG